MNEELREDGLELFDLGLSEMSAEEMVEYLKGERVVR